MSRPMSKLSEVFLFDYKAQDYPEDFEIRGEIILTHEAFRKLNMDREENGEACFC